jgi:hypothetical protein
MKRVSCPVVVALMAFFGVELLAQSAVPTQTRTIAFSEGRIFVDGQMVDSTTGPVPLRKGFLVRTEDGRAEVTLDGGTILFLGNHSSVREIDDRFSDPQGLEMLSGSAVLWTRGAKAAMQCEDRVTLFEFGIFRFDFNPSVPRNIDDVCSFKVFGGTAWVYLASLRSSLAEGKRMGLNRHCGDMLPTYDFDTAARDDMDRWSLARMRLRDGR